MRILGRHNKSKYSGKILYQKEQWHKRSFLWNIEEHPTSSGPFFERLDIKHTIYFGYLTQDGQEHQKRLMDFLFKPAKTHAFSKYPLHISVNDCTTKSECVKQIIICHDYARLSMWEISPIIQCWIDINITIKSDLRLELTQLRVVTTALWKTYREQADIHFRS